ncbi:MAG: glutamine-hydrolyzing carbamoyl-phosphate synthase small subunit [Oligoflexia bacterium]|nr:glutamine-hydrolyzing carbamoyl-phosphate synthase small subunit [Oligoflexia bacterium]
MHRKAVLTLSNGSWLEGELIGAPLISSGELVFTTGMVGYNEAITDPSFFGQILTFSYPLIGNYGVPLIGKEGNVNSDDGFESPRIHASAIIITRGSEDAYHWKKETTLDKWLKSQGVPCLVGVDTRELIHKIRDSEKLLAILTPDKPEGQRMLHEKFADHDHREFFDPSLYEVISCVSTRERKIFGKGKKRIALIDCGFKWNIMRNLLRFENEIELVPWDYDFTKIDCDAWVISNGPGDPQNTGDLFRRVAGILKDGKPLLGICMGNQILALSAGASTKRLVHGHRGHNQPVYLFGSKKGYMTSQNHGYVVTKESLPEDWTPWFINANDESIEGIRHVEKPFRGVQFHPEAAGGPCDTQWIFSEFIGSI